MSKNSMEEGFSASSAMKDRERAHVRGDITQRQIALSPLLLSVAPVHLLQPPPISHINLSAAICLRIPLLQDLPQLLPSLIRAFMVQRRQNLTGDAECHVGDIEERIRERRRGQLVVFGKRARVQVEAQASGVGDDDVGDRSPAVVNCQCYWSSLDDATSAEQPQEDKMKHYLVDEQR